MRYRIAIEDFSEITLHQEQWGRMVESAIGAHLLNHAISERFNSYYWRHRSDEVDFVLERRGKVIGLEIISGIRQRTFGMKAFQKEFSPDRVLQVGNSGISWQEFLTINPVELF